MKQPNSLINYLLLLGAGIIWGSQYFLNKLALGSFSLWSVTAGRIVIGAITLTFLLALLKEKKSQQSKPFWNYLPDFILIGALEATLPCILITWAQKSLPSSSIAILIGTVPLLATLFEFLFVKEHTISLKKIIGMVLGFLGVISLVGRSLLFQSLFDFHSSNKLPLMPVLAVLTAASCFSVTMLLIKVRIGTALGPIRSAQGILLGASLSALPLLWWESRTVLLYSSTIAPSSLIALLLLGIFCGGIVYILYVKLIHRAGPSFASTCNYLVPPIGAFIGIFFSKESVSVNMILALVLILVALSFSREKKRFDHSS